ncbi:MAG: DNA-3-methyladenine glycosylase I [Prevotella salivae]|nr:DNA-3-methyladenine glycosylase I [Segatella salivae]
MKQQPTNHDLTRCAWANSHPLLQQYHDEEWGVPVHDDSLLFMYLLMESMSCGLSWLLMLKKKEIFRTCFANFDYKVVATFSINDINQILSTEGMIHSERKVKAMIENARAFCQVRKEYGSFDAYIWSFTKGKSKQYASHQQHPCVRNTLSDHVAKDLKKRGFKYVGTIIIYSFLQAIGIINDHEHTCFRYSKD